MENLLITQYKVSDNGIDFHLKFKDRITLIDGESGVGKTMLFKAIERDTLIKNSNIICLNYDDIPSGNIHHVLSTSKNKVIVIDNADVALSIEQRVQISTDLANQYIVFTHSTDGWLVGRNSLTELEISKGKGQLNYIF